jgi:hypothetical protein
MKYLPITGPHSGKIIEANSFIENLPKIEEAIVEQLIDAIRKHESCLPYLESYQLMLDIVERLESKGMKGNGK